MKIRELFYPLFNISIKGLTLLGKFVLVFYLAKNLTPSDVGLYGLFVSLVFYSLYAVGLDFYTYSTREIVKIDRLYWWKYIKSQLFLVFLTYITIFPIVLYIVSNILDIKWLLFFIGLLILEHFNQEAMRLLIVMHKNVLANNLNFIRQGLWCFILIFLIELRLLPIKLEVVFSIWGIFSFITLFISCIFLVKNLYFVKESIDFFWIKKGLKTCAIFLIATLCIRLITTLDRVWLEHLGSLAVVGAYSLYMSLTNSLIAFLDTGVYSFSYPKMIKDRKNRVLFLMHTKRMAIQTILFTLLISICLSLLTPKLLNWINKSIYQEYILVFYILLLANIFYCLSMIFHYILYSHNEDKKILFSHLLSLIIFIITTHLFSIANINHSVALGVLFSFLGLFIIKIICAIPILINGEEK